MDVNGAFSFRSLLELDVRLSDQMRLNPDKKRFLWYLCAFMAHTGDSWFWLAGLGLIWLFGNAEWHYKSALMSFSLVFLAVFVLIVKFTVKRQRPPGEWGAIYRSTDPHSFPSGHAARVAMLAVLAIGTGPEWFAILVILWSPLVSLARVIMGVHYLSDVIVGMLIGIIVGLGMLELQPLLVSRIPYFF